MKLLDRFRQPEPQPSEPMSEAEFERMIEAWIIRGWQLLFRTMNTATIQFEETDKIAILAGRHKHGHAAKKTTRKVLTRSKFEEPWLTKKDRRLLGREA